MARLRAFLKDDLHLLQPSLSAATSRARDEMDVARPDEWANSVCFTHEPGAMENFWPGLGRPVPQQHPEGGSFMVDYRMLAFPRTTACGWTTSCHGAAGEKLYGPPRLT